MMDNNEQEAKELCDIRHEHFTLLLKSARRAAYDLKHAADLLTLTEYSDFGNRFVDRAQTWLEIFAPDGVKDYRHKLHHEIRDLERRVEFLKSLCRDNGINPEHPDDPVW